jgi:RecA/RadA recombinase
LDISLRGKYFDEKTGNGGIPCGRILRLDGQSGGGKSLLAWQIVSDCIRKGGMACYFDIEKAITEEFADKIDIPKDGIILIPNLTTLEKVFHAALIYLMKVAELDDPPPFGVIVIDSVQAMLTEDQLIQETTIGDSNYGRKAKLMGEVLSKMLPYLDQLNYTLVLTNQLRANVSKSHKYEDDWIVPTNNAQEFFAQQIVRLYKSTVITEGTNEKKRKIGHTMRLVVKKSRYAGDGREVKVELIFDKGLNNEGAVLDALKAVGLVYSAGSKGSKIIIEGEEFCFKAADFPEVYKTNQKVRDWAIRQIEATFKSNESWHVIDADTIKQSQITAEDEAEMEKIRMIKKSLAEEETNE